MVTTRRGTEVVLNLAVLCLLMAGMALINDEVRGHLVNVVAGDRATELSMIAAPVGNVTRVVFATLRQYQGADGSVLAFGVGAVVLLGLMLRS